MSKLITNNIPQININWLVKSGYISEGARTEGSYQARDGDPVIEIKSDFTESVNRILILKYRIKHDENFIKSVIRVVAIKSNLKNNSGYNFYLICPISHLRSKILYFDAQNNLYVNRQAYSSKIYYPLQLCDKESAIYERAYIIRRKLLKSLMEFKRYSYNQNKTRLQQRIEKLMDLDRAIALLKDERSDRLFQRFNSK